MAKSLQDGRDNEQSQKTEGVSSEADGKGQTLTAGPARQLGRDDLDDTTPGVCS
jgi:hypothetical protein